MLQCLRKHAAPPGYAALLMHVVALAMLLFLKILLSLVSGHAAIPEHATLPGYASIPEHAAPLGHDALPEHDASTGHACFQQQQ